MVRSQALNMMTIGKLALAGSVGVETVRFYQRRGLLAEPSRDGGVRRYDHDQLNRLRFIRSAQAAGFTLAQIAELLALDATEDRARARELANTRIKAIDQKIEALEAARKSLRRLAIECAESTEGRCPIIRAFER